MLPKAQQQLRVFLIYASRDRHIVHGLCTQLRKEIFLDPLCSEESLLPGHDDALKIRKTLADTDVVIVCLSSAYHENGPENLAQEEIDLALNIAAEQPDGLHATVVLKLERCSTPEWMQHWPSLNFFDEDGYYRLMRALRKRANEVILVGQSVGDYYIEDMAEKRGTIKHFRGRHIIDESRRVAIQVIHAALVSDPDFYERFHATMGAASSLYHPNIVTLFDFNYSDQINSYYLVTELLQQGSLQSLLQKQRTVPTFSLLSGLDIIRQAASALAFAHNRDVIHGHLSPAVMLLERSTYATYERRTARTARSERRERMARARTRASARRQREREPEPEPGQEPNDSTSLYTEQAQGTGGRESYTLKLSNFGFASLLDGIVSLKRSNATEMTVYASPEQWRGAALDSRSDIYSLGVVLYEMTTGHQPFEARHAADPLLPRVYNPYLTGEIEEVILRCLAKNPDHRYASASDLASDLEQAQRNPLLAEVPMGILPMPDAPFTQEPSHHMRVVLEKSHLHLMPGRSREVLVEVQNRGTLARRLSLKVEGVPGMWVDGLQKDIYLNPIDKTRTTFSVTVPRSLGKLAGTHAVKVQVQADDRESASAHARWNIRPNFMPLLLKVVPALLMVLLAGWLLTSLVMGDGWSSLLMSDHTPTTLDGRDGKEETDGILPSEPPSIPASLATPTTQPVIAPTVPPSVTTTLAPLTPVRPTEDPGSAAEERPLAIPVSNRRDAFPSTTPKHSPTLTTER